METNDPKNQDTRSHPSNRKEEVAAVVWLLVVSVATIIVVVALALGPGKSAEFYGP